MGENETHRLMRMLGGTIIKLHGRNLVAQLLKLLHGMLLMLPPSRQFDDCEEQLQGRLW